MEIVVHVYRKAGEFQKVKEFFKKWSSRGSTSGEGTAKIMIGQSEKWIENPWLFKLLRL